MSGDLGSCVSLLICSISVPTETEMSESLHVCISTILDNETCLFWSSGLDGLIGSYRHYPKFRKLLWWLQELKIITPFQIISIISLMNAIPPWLVTSQRPHVFISSQWQLCFGEWILRKVGCMYILTSTHTNMLYFKQLLLVNIYSNSWDSGMGNMFLKWYIWSTWN